MNIKDIYKVVKHVLIKDATLKDLYNDIEATAYEYAFQKIKNLPRLKTYEDIIKDDGKNNQKFMHHYLQALKTLRHQ
jgi:hypothetical protein